MIYVSPAFSRHSQHETWMNHSFQSGADADAVSSHDLHGHVMKRLQQLVSEPTDTPSACRPEQQGPPELLQHSFMNLTRPVNSCSLLLFVTYLIEVTRCHSLQRKCQNVGTALRALSRLSANYTRSDSISLHS